MQEQLNVSLNNSLINSTADDPPRGLLVVVITWFTLFAILATVVLNGIIIVVYVARESLRTPFNAYIVNIAITELLLALTAMPGNFIRSYYGY